jgi:hypothetical protein
MSGVTPFEDGPGALVKRFEFIDIPAREPGRPGERTGVRELQQRQQIRVTELGG